MVKKATFEVKRCAQNEDELSKYMEVMTIACSICGSSRGLPSGPGYSFLRAGFGRVRLAGALIPSSAPCGCGRRGRALGKTSSSKLKS
jgi:hypothetical protein